jgi:mannitol 2-dehydrogenase
MAIPAVRSFLEELLHREAMPTVAEIPGHPREEYVASVLERFANPGVRDQIARLCVDGTAKFATFLVPTVVGQIEAGGPTARAATALAGWAHYLAAVDPTAQAPGVRASRSFREQFSEAYRRIAAQGPIAAMEHDPARARIGDAR